MDCLHCHHLYQCLVGAHRDAGVEVGDGAADVFKELLQLVEVALVEAVPVRLVFLALCLVRHAEHLVRHLDNTVSSALLWGKLRQCRVSASI